MSKGVKIPCVRGSIYHGKESIFLSCIAEYVYWKKPLLLRVWSFDFYLDTLNVNFPSVHRIGTNWLKPIKSGKSIVGDRDKKNKLRKW